MAKETVCITIKEYEQLKRKERLANYMLRRLGMSLDEAVRSAKRFP
jgi:hypothetical protein